MNDSFVDETQLDIDSAFTDFAPPEEAPSDTVEILPNGDEPVITATPTPVQITATPTPAQEVTTTPPEQAEVSPIPTDTETSLGDSSETEHTIDDIYNLLTEQVKALEEQDEKQEQARAEEAEALTEYRSYMAEQSRNVLSVSSLIFITLAFLTGILLARVVWRKL